MAAVVSHAMRRFPTTPPDAVYSYGLRAEGSHPSWSPSEEGESALSRSMRYADPWLYGSVRAPGGLVLAPAFVLCACSDYINGTKRSSKHGSNKSPTTCKNCKGTRLPLSPGDAATKFGTVRCYPTSGSSLAAATTPLRAGTMRISSSSRPSILPTADPYDLMRRSRLSVSDTSSNHTFRARSISPNKAKNGDSRSHSGTRVKEAPSSPTKSPSSKIGPNSTIGRRSILECDINPYELMSSEASSPRNSSITLVNGQRIRVRPPSASDSDYEDVQVRHQRPRSKFTTAPTKISTTNGFVINKCNMHQQHHQKSNEKESECNRFKSILKKPSTTFSDTDSNSREHSPSPAHKSGSHFYIPMPGNAPRKKVQFLVEIENALVQQDQRQDNEGSAEEIDDLVPVNPPREARETQPPGISLNEASDNKTVCKLRRSVSERFRQESNSKVVFLDTMALRIRVPRGDCRINFAEKDLERLDGLSSRTRRKSPTPLRPNEPPPPPPPAIRPEEKKHNEEIEVNEEKAENKGIQKTKKNEFQNFEKKDIQKIEIEPQVIVKESPQIIVKESSQIIAKESPQIIAKEIQTYDNKELSLRKLSDNEVLVTQKEVNDFLLKAKENLRSPSEPPAAPPRKRSNNKQPNISIIPPLNQTMKTEQTSLEQPKKTVVQIINSSPTVHKLQIKNEFTDMVNVQTVSVLDNPQRKTSIMITGDDCYSTVNVNDDVPLYQSSVVVKDCGISDITAVSQNKKSSTIYITGNFITPADVSPKENSAPKEEVKESKEEPQRKNNVLLDKFNQNSIPSSELLQELLKDPVEAVRRNLVPHVCGKSDVTRRQRDRKFIKDKELVETFLELNNDVKNMNSVMENSFLNLRNNYESIGDDVSSEHSSSTQYELMDASSECYTDHSNRSSITEEELANRTKFYELLADAALAEVTENEDHHYESIKMGNSNQDPIYEEIEIPPPLPANPPPSSLLDDLHLDKEYTTRSIFEGASKYDILSYLVDAKERGIVQEDSYNGYHFGHSNGSVDEDVKENYRNFHHLSTVSDSSEDNSLINTLIDEKATFQKAAEVERNDSGVGSETSKCSLSKYRTKQETSMNCEDCDGVVETSAEMEPLICRKCVKKRTERKEIITEIVETEEKYSRDLQIILEEFYQPMLVAGLLTPEQLSAIFLNVEELLENSQSLAERLRDAVEIAVEQGDEDLLTVNIGKLFLEAAPMLHGFETYCVRQGAASLLLASLEKDKELLRIFLRVSQMENTMLRRMNLNSFLMVPVQRVTKYPLLLARLYKVTPAHHETKEQLKEAQHKIELHLNHMNSETKDVPSKLWRRIGSSSGRRSSTEMDLVNIKLRKLAVDVLEWNHDEAKFALEGKLLFTQPTDNNWRKGRTIKLTPVNALLVINGKPSTNRSERNDENGLVFSRHSSVREAALLLVRDKNGRYSLLREPLYLDRCVIAADPAWQSYFEVQELLGKDTFIFKAEDEDQTKIWYTQLQYHAQGMGAWRKRRNALANIMINGMGLRS